MEHPKFEQKLRDRVIDRTLDQQTHGGYGIVLEFQKETNTVHLILAHPGSDMPGETYQFVPIPTQIGIQQYAPEPGRPCWVEFRAGSPRSPVVTHFYNHKFQEIDQTRQYKSKNNIPRYILAM